MSSTPPTEADLSAARDLLAFIDRSPTPWHAVAETARRLQKAGFRELREADEWALVSGDRCTVVRGGSIAAFAVGGEPLATAGYRIVAAHTDSPNLRLKPNPDVIVEGARQLGVEPYGGVIMATWLDRDLSLAGRLALADGSNVLVDLERPLLRIPSLAIHLNRSVNTDGLVLNPQRHLAPIWALEAATGLADIRELVVRARPGLAAKDVLGMDLCLYEAHPGILSGASEELLHVGRLDNLGSCHAAVTALAAAAGRGLAATAALVLYDHEEVGSRTAQGAASSFLRSVLARVAGATGSGAQGLERALSRSWLVSVDMAHAVHPNYADLHEPQHKPRLGGGPVVKTNHNQSYATDGQTAAYFVGACRRAGFEPQHFVTRSDLPCGTTVGPITAAELGVRTVDVGNPMLSMHSAREMAATTDVRRMIDALGHHFE
jgi:aspartyl aminopeptidase